MADREYVVVFSFPESASDVFAGLVDGGWAFAPTIATAVRWTDRATAQRILDNAYGQAVRRHGEVVPVEDVTG